LVRHKKSLRSDAIRLIGKISPPIRYVGVENIPTTGGFQILVNHYARPGFNTAWIALAVSAVLPAETTWIMSDEWIFKGNPLRFVLRPAMRFVLASIHWVYGFLSMPTMEEGYSDLASRSAAVRRVIEFARCHAEAIIGLAPEGRDSPQDGVGLAPPGGGKFMRQINRMGFTMLPVALFEKDGYLLVRFGKPFDLPKEFDASPKNLDLTVRKWIQDRLLDLYRSPD
jgi:1-acyl-sn-glycerol-3-phosphate acyltransferase